MANFDFTVRATDSDGAFADRNFSITINNTRVERYMIINNTDAYTSSDMLNWTIRPGAGGWDCVYGNGMWLVASTTYTDANLSNYSYSGYLGGLGTANSPATLFRRSVDGINFNTIVDTIVYQKPDGTVFVPPAGNAKANGRLSFSNGYFWFPMSYGSDYVSGILTQYVARSADGITWTMLASPAKGSFLPVSGKGLPYRAYQRVLDNGTDIFLPNYGSGTGSINNCYGWKSSDLGVTWTPVQDASGRSNGNTVIQSGMLTRINGMWFAAVNHTANVPFMVSSDGMNWSTSNCSYSLPVGSFMANNIVYANGTLFATMNSSNLSNAIAGPIIQSVDGITWTQAPFTAPVLPGATTTYNAVMSMFCKNGFVAYNTNYSESANNKPSHLIAGGTGAVTVSYSNVPNNFNGIAAM